MKKIFYLLLLTLIIILTSCSKSDLKLQTMEDVIVGKKWIANNEEFGFFLSKEGEFYSISRCGEDVLLGDWIIEGDKIKYRYYENSQEITILFGMVSEYTATHINLLSSSSTMTMNIIYNAYTAVYGCIDVLADNYNANADCDDGSCSYCDMQDVYVNELIDLSLPIYSEIATTGNSIFVEGGVKGIIIYHGVGDSYKIYDRNCSYVPCLSCSQIDTVISGIAYCGCCTSAFLISNNGESINAPALLELKQYNWSLDNNILRIFN